MPFESIVQKIYFLYHRIKKQQILPLLDVILSYVVFSGYPPFSDSYKTFFIFFICSSS